MENLLSNLLLQVCDTPAIVPLAGAASIAIPVLQVADATGHSLNALRQFAGEAGALSGPSPRTVWWTLPGPRFECGMTTGGLPVSRRTTYQLAVPESLWNPGRTGTAGQLLACSV